MFEKHTQWLTAGEFLTRKPINIFHRECEKPEYPEGLPRNVHMYARRTFRMPKTARSASLLISADDCYKLYINGEFVAMGPAPGYPQAYYVNRIDVLKYLRRGENVIALDVYYQGLINRVWVSGDLRQGFICELRVDDKVVLRSDERFRYTCPLSHVTGETCGYQTQFLENFDAREEPEGWKEVSFNDSKWPSCCIKPETDYQFIEQETPVLETEVIDPVYIGETENGRLYDFGREIAGHLIAEAEGTAGKKLLLHSAEELDEKGDARWHMRCNCDYEDSFIMNGKVSRMETYDYKGFRYVQVLEEDSVRLISLRARVRHYPVNREACKLETSDRILKDVFELCKDTLIYGVQEGFLDCPSREKGQYSGDLAVTSLSHLYITGDSRLYRKALNDWMRSSFIAPALMAVFPGGLMQEIADYSFLFPMCAYRYYLHTHDTQFLTPCIEAARGIVDTYRKYARADGLLETVSEAWNLVDWPKNLRDNYDFKVDNPVDPGCHNVINSMYIGAVIYTNKLCEAAGLPSYSRVEPLTASFNRVFIDTETGLYVDAEGSKHSSLHSNIFPVLFGIAEDSAKVADWLVGRGMECGVYMAFFYLKALARAGKYADVYRLLTSDGIHSWGNMLKEGATTLFEAWGKDQKWNTSLCHPWASAPVAVLIEDVLGITPEVTRGEAWHCRLPESVKTLKLTLTVAGRKVKFIRESGKTTLEII